MQVGLGLETGQRMVFILRDTELFLLWDKGVGTFSQFFSALCFISTINEFSHVAFQRSMF